MPTTLHELYKRNDKANVRHPILHAELFFTLLKVRNIEEILGEFKSYGIGIIYEPSYDLVTTHLGINGSGQTIRTSFGTANCTELAHRTTFNS